MKKFYVILMVVGTILPWIFFGQFFGKEGVSFSLFAQALFANGAAGGATTDLLLSSLVFWGWSYQDAQKKQINHWWLVLPMTLSIGLCLALPYYLWRRHERA